MDITKEVLKRIMPTPEIDSHIQEVVDKLSKKAKQRGKELGIDIECYLVGSIAKGTHLKDPDIDLFLLFSKDTPEETLEKVGLAIGWTLLPDGEERYAQHPYVHGICEGLECDIVPCYKLNSVAEKMTAVDRTPFHTEYVISHLDDSQKDDVRLLKQFMKGTEIYGAEISVQGFSGYLCELLVLNYKTFEGVVKNASKWERVVCITLEDGSSRKFSETLVVVDPVDANRNVAAAVSPQTMARFVHACKCFHKDQKLEFFFPKPQPALNSKEMEEIISRRKGCFAGLVLKKPGLIDDILYSQLRKALKAVRELLGRHGFSSLNSGYFKLSKNILFIFELEAASLPDVRVHGGPPVWNPQAESFLKRWNGAEDALTPPYIRGVHWTVDVKRKFKDPHTLIEKRLLEINLGKNLNEMAILGFDVFDLGQLLENEGYRVALGRFLDRSFPWDR